MQQCRKEDFCAHSLTDIPEADHVYAFRATLKLYLSHSSSFVSASPSILSSISPIVRSLKFNPSPLSLSSKDTINIWWLELENLGHTGGLGSWNSALGRRLRVQAPGRGSFSPVATFKLCSYRSLLQVTPACITLTDRHNQLSSLMKAFQRRTLEAAIQTISPIFPIY